MNDKYVNVLGSQMHYIEQGSGDPILFLHGVPTLWQNLIPHLCSIGRCITIDLIGFGKADKPDIEDYIRYIEAFIKALDLKHITLVMHGWGSIIGFNYAMHHQENCKALVFYESYLRKVTADDFSLPIHEEYLKELPLNNNITNQIIEAYSTLLQQSTIPKLMIYTVPGLIATVSTVMWAKEHLPNLEIIETETESALDFSDENDSVMMGETISVWLQGIEQLQSMGNA